MTGFPRRQWLAGCISAALIVSAQARANESTPAPWVVVESVTQADFSYPLEFPARVAGSRQVEVRAQVSGLLQRRTYQEGQTVAPGQVLFELDARTYQAHLARAKAALAQEHARHRHAQRTLERTEKMQTKGFASQSELDNARSAVEQTQANIQAAEAEVLARQIDLDNTTVTAPIAGITSQEARSEGSLVIAADPSASLLTHITQLDPVYVNFAYPDQLLETLRHDAQQGWLEMDEASLEVVVNNHPHTGRVSFTDSLINRSTGTVTARAVIPNPEHSLLPGQFVRLRIKGLHYPRAISVPEKALSQNAQGPLVYVVDETGVARARAVRTGITQEGRWLIHEGLNSGDQVIVDGLKHVQADQKVAVVTADQGALVTTGGEL